MCNSGLHGVTYISVHGVLMGLFLGLSSLDANYSVSLLTDEDLAFLKMSLWFLF